MSNRPMTAFAVLFALTISWSAGVHTASAQTDVWTSHGPDGGTVSKLAIDPQTPTTLYAGTSGGGVYKSTNGGETWSVVTGLTGKFRDSILIDPQTPTTVYVGTDAGLFKSTDGASSWSQLGNDLPDLRPRAIDPQTPTTLYARGSGGLFKSTDGGNSWTAINTGLRFNNGGLIPVSSLIIDPQTPTTLYAAGNDAGVFKTLDGGALWTRVSTPAGAISFPSLAINPQNPSTIYTAYRGIFRSRDGGASWVTVSTGLTTLPVWSVAIDPQTPTTIYAATAAGLYKSLNEGENWSRVDIGSSASVGALAIDPQNATTLYVGPSEAGILKSTDGGNSWGVANTGIISTVVASLATDPKSPATVYAGTGGSGFFKSLNGGESWSAVNSNLRASAIVIDPETPTTLYAGGSRSPSERGVYKSSDGGETWSLVGLAGVAVSGLVIDPASPDTLYAGTTSSSGVFKSVDGGATWNPVSTGLTAPNIWALAIDPQTPTTVYAGTGYNYPNPCRGVFKSTDGGANWIELGPFNRSISALAIDPQTPTTVYAASSQWACGPGGPQDPGIYKSIDGGSSWTAISTQLTIALAIDPATPTTVYAANTSGVVQSTDGGASWTPMNEGLTTASVGMFAIDSPATTIYAGTGGGGVFARALRFPLTVATTGDGAGTITSSPEGIDCGADCSELYPSGTTVTLTAVPADNSVFTGWSGCDSVDGANCTVTMDAFRSVVAAFELRRFALTIEKSGVGRGTVTSSPVGIDCGSDCSEAFVLGTTVTLTATPAVGSIFIRWGGCDSSSGRTCTVKMGAARSVQASFFGLPMGF